MPGLPPLPGDGSLVYGMGRLDAKGRVTDRAVFAALGWARGTRCAAALREDVLVVCPDPAGPLTISAHHSLVIAARYRRWCGLLAGDRVLLVADLVHERLWVQGPAAVRAMIVGYHAWLTGDDPDQLSGDDHDQR